MSSDAITPGALVWATTPYSGKWMAEVEKVDAATMTALVRCVESVKGAGSVKVGSTLNVAITRLELIRTKTGKVLTGAEIEALADEAEAGYDVSHLRKEGQ